MRTAKIGPDLRYMIFDSRGLLYLTPIYDKQLDARNYTNMKLFTLIFVTCLYFST